MIQTKIRSGRFITRSSCIILNQKKVVLLKIFLGLYDGCFRKSIDLYRSVPSSRLNFMGTPNLSRLGSSFLSSTLTSRHAAEILPSLSKPFLPPSTDNQHPQERHSSSHSLLPPWGSSAKNLPHYHKSSKASHELPLSRQISYGQSVLNGMCNINMTSCFLIFFILKC